MVKCRRLASGIAILFLLAGPALADDSEVEALRAQLKATVLQLRQLQDQQSAATQPTAAPGPDEAALKAKLAAAQAQLRAAQKSAAEAAGAQASLAKAQADNAALTATATASAAELEKFKTAYNQTQEANRGLTADRDRLKLLLDRETNVATVCQSKNDKLVAFSQDLLNAYGKVTLGQVLAAREPFLGLQRVKLENIEQDREDTIRSAVCDARVDAAGAKPAAKTAGH